MIQKFDVADGKRTIEGVGFPGIVPVLGPSSLPIRSLAPELGQDTAAVLAAYPGFLRTDRTGWLRRPRRPRC